MQFLVSKNFADRLRKLRKNDKLYIQRTNDYAITFPNYLHSATTAVHRLYRRAKFSFVNTMYTQNHRVNEYIML